MASEDFKPIYYIPHPDEYVGRDSAFPDDDGDDEDGREDPDSDDDE